MNKHMNVSIAEAKNRLSKIINEVVFAKKRVILNSHGQPKAAMISFDELKKFEEMEETFSPSKNKRLTALDKAAWLREQIYNRKKENMHDSSMFSSSLSRSIFGCFSLIFISLFSVASLPRRSGSSLRFDKQRGIQI